MCSMWVRGPQGEVLAWNWNLATGIYRLDLTGWGTKLVAPGWVVGGIVGGQCDGYRDPCLGLILARVKAQLLCAGDVV